MTAIETKRLIAVLAAAFPSATRTANDLEAMASVWHRVLANVPYDEADRAVYEVIGTSRFMPSVSELLGRIRAKHERPSRSGLEAWGDVMRAVSRFGAYRDPEFADPHVATVVRAMGWQELCASENQVADRARFVDAYEQIAKRTEREQQFASLPRPQTLGGRQTHGELTKARENPDSPGLVQGQRQLGGTP